VHYVSQEVHLTDETRSLTPAQLVVAGDIERRLLMAQCNELEALADAEKLDAVSVILVEFLTSVMVEGCILTAVQLVLLHPASCEGKNMLHVLFCFAWNYYC